MWAHIRCTWMSWNCGNGNHQLSFNYFPNILLLYYPLLLYNLLLYIHIYIILYIIIYNTHIYFYYYVIILSNYFPKIQFSVMAMVVAIMPFGRLSSKIYVKFLHISSWNCCPWLWCKPFYYWKSAQLRVSLNCCRHSVKPGSIPC